MSGWVRTAAEWFERPDTEDLGAEAVVLHLSALGYCAVHTTNGHVPRRALRRLYPVPDQDNAIAALVQAGWWKSVEDGYQVEAWEKHILSEQEVKKIRDQNQVRSERHRRHERGDHSLCERCWYVRNHGNGVTNGVTNSVGDAPLTEPNRPDPKGRGGREGEAGGSAPSGPSAALRDADAATPPGEPRSALAYRPGLPHGVAPRVLDANGQPVEVSLDRYR